MASRFQDMMWKLRPLAWVLPAIAAFATYDRWLDSFYGGHVYAQSVFVSRNQDARVRGHDVLVLGDSCARYAIDTGYLSEELDLSAFNIATFGAGMPGQISTVLRALNDGHRYSAIVVMGTETFTKRGQDGFRVLRQFYANPTAIGLWYRSEGLSAEEALSLAWAMASPTYAAGNGPRTFVDRLLAAGLEQGSWWGVVDELDRSKRRNLAREKRYRNGRGQTRAGPKEHRESVIQRRTEKFARVKLRDSYRWSPAAIRPYYYEFLQEMDARNIPVFHAFCPRAMDVTQHENWKRNIAHPIGAWLRAMTKAHPSFVNWMPKRMSFESSSYVNTESHINVDAARKVTQRLLPAMRKVLDARAKKSTRTKRKD